MHDPPYIKNAKVGAFDNIGFGLLIVWTGCLQIVLDKGQEDDWFGAVWVRWAVAALIFAFIGWIWRSWTNPKGLVDLHVLKNRNFRTGCFLIALLGMCIYITIAILPLYYQEILGYTAFTAGLVVGPRGIGSFIGSPVIGFLGYAHRQSQAALGWISSASASAPSLRHREPRHRPLHPARADSYHRLRAQLCVCAPGQPLTTSTLSREEMGNATGLFNMLRNIGGSIGIAMATTALIRRAAQHQNDLAGQLSPSNPVLQQKAAQIGGYLGHRLGPNAARPGSFGLLYGLMQQQAALKAYVDVFRWTALLAFFCAAAVWLFKKPIKHTAPPPGVH